MGKYWWHEDGIDVFALKEAVIAAARREPDKVYQPDRGFYNYTHAGDVPGCLIGQAVYDITGKPVDPTPGDTVGSDLWCMALGADVRENGLTWPSREHRAAFEFILRAQQAQDDHETWGHAIELAVDEDYNP